MKLSTPRTVIALLALPTYIWAKAIALRYFHWAPDPATDIYVPILFAALGLTPKPDVTA